MNITSQRNAMRELVDKLEAERKGLGLTDEAFAKKLGVTRALWSLTRSGKFAPNMSLLSSAVVEFPGYRDLVLRCMAEYHKARSVA